MKFEYDRALYEQRSGIERMFRHFQINRTITTEKDLLAAGVMSSCILQPPDADSDAHAALMLR